MEIDCTMYIQKRDIQQLIQPQGQFNLQNENKNFRSILSQIWWNVVDLQKLI